MFSEVKMLMHVRNDSIKSGNPESPSITPLYVKYMFNGNMYLNIIEKFH